MTERYFITGAQVGAIQALLEVNKLDDAKELLEEVIANQFIGNMDMPYDDYIIRIVKKD